MKIISTTSELDQLCAQLSGAGFVAVDTEFLRERTFWPDLCLVQLAWEGNEAVVDPLTPGMDLSPLWSLMSNKDVVKVFHAARQDIEIIFCHSSKIPTPLFDTQIAAMACGFGNSVSYVNLVKKITGRVLDKSWQFSDWKRRPLTEVQLDYALQDVTHLRDVYTYLREELKKNGRAAWLEGELRPLLDPNTYSYRPEDAWKKLRLKVSGRKKLSVLMELAGWREQVAKQLNVPRRQILRDENLYEIVNQLPENLQQLSRLRSVTRSLDKSSHRATEVLEAVRIGLSRDLSRVDQIRKGKPPSPKGAATLELLKVLLKACAARYGVASRLIADSSDLEKMAQEESIDNAFLQGWKGEIFGRYAMKLKCGELALTLKKGEVTTVPFSQDCRDVDS